jgi:hypothetical protein
VPLTLSTERDTRGGPAGRARVGAVASGSGVFAGGVPPGASFCPGVLRPGAGNSKGGRRGVTCGGSVEGARSSLGSCSSCAYWACCRILQGGGLDPGVASPVFHDTAVVENFTDSMTDQ